MTLIEDGFSFFFFFPFSNQFKILIDKNSDENGQMELQCA